MGENPISRREFLRRADNYSRLIPGVGPAYGIARDVVDSLRAREIKISPWTMAGIAETGILVAACEPETDKNVA